MQLALLVGVALRLLWIGALGGQPIFDGQTYFEAAARIASTLSYAVEGRPTAYYPVGYPGLLAALFAIVGAKLSAAWVLNLLAGGACLLCLHRIALGLGLPPVAAVRVVWLAAINPIYVTYSSLVVSETVFTFLMLFGVALCIEPRVSPRRLVLGGILFGGAALVRPHGLLLPLLVGFAGAGGSAQTLAMTRPRRTLWLALGLVVCMSPWWVRNALAFGEFVPVSTNGGVNLLIGNNPHANGRYRFDELVYAELARDALDCMSGGDPELSCDRKARRLALEHVRTQPLDAIRLLPRKLFFTYLPDLTGLGWNSAPDTEARRSVLRVLPIPIALHHVALLLLAFAGLVRAFRTLRAQATGAGVRVPWWHALVAPMLALPLAVVSGLTCMQLLTFGMPRFHFPMMPWLELLAAIALTPRRFLDSSLRENSQPS